MDATKRPLLIAVRLILALLALAAIGTQFAIQVRLELSVVNFFSYFTNLSNLFAAIILGFGAFQLAAQRAPSASHDLLRTVSTLNMAVVGIVFTTLLRDVDLGSLLPWVNTVLHDIMPVAVVLEWFFYPPRTAGSQAAAAMPGISVALPGICAASRRNRRLVSLPFPQSCRCGELWRCRAVRAWDSSRLLPGGLGAAAGTGSPSDLKNRSGNLIG
jgi:hypothetical protein